MTPTKSDVIDSTHNQRGFSKSKSTQLVEAALKIIKSNLESGETVPISGFGKFEVKHKHQRRGRNPQTGNNLILDARTVVIFKCSGVLRDKMNGNVSP